MTYDQNSVSRDILTDNHGFKRCYASKNPKGIRKIVTGIDRPRLVILVSCDFYVTVQNWLVETGDLSQNQLILCIADLLIASEVLSIKRFDTLHNL